MTFFQGGHWSWKTWKSWKSHGTFFGHGKSHGIPKIFQIVMEKSWKFFYKDYSFFFIKFI